MNTAIAAHLDAITTWQEDLYRDLHRHPELSMQEVRTRGVIAAELERLGYEVIKIGGGVVGVLANGEGPTVLARADFDGLPVTEATGLEYASTDTTTDESGRTVGVMHACGHDVHTACALAAASAMANCRSEWHGTYVALFQPGEETAAGAKSMVDAGLVDRIPRPDVAVGQHVLGFPTGTLHVSEGPVLSTAATIRVTIPGVGSHGSMPHLGVDPVVTAAAIVLRLQTIVAREIAPGDFGVVTVGSLQAGSVSNVIPDHAVLLLNIRAYSEEVRAKILTAIERIVKGECAAAGAPSEPTLEVMNSYPLTDNDPGVSAKVAAAFRAAFGEDRVSALPPQTASEDFSTVPRAFEIPYCYWGLGGFPEGETPPANHNPKFAPVMQPTLRTGAESLITAALAWLGNDA